MVRSQSGNHVLDHVDFTAPRRQHGLDCPHQECLCPERSTIYCIEPTIGDLSGARKRSLKKKVHCPAPIIQVAKAIAVHKDADACHPANGANVFSEAWSSDLASSGTASIVSKS